MRGTFRLHPRKVQPLSYFFTTVAYVQHGETDDLYPTSKAFACLSATTCHMAHQFCHPATTLASSTDWLPHRFPAGRPRPGNRTRRDPTPFIVLLSWHAAPLCRCAGRTALGRWASHLCHPAQLACPRLLVCSPL